MRFGSVFLLIGVALLWLIDRLNSAWLREVVIVSASGLAYRLSKEKRRANHRFMEIHAPGEEVSEMVRNTFRVFWRDVFETVGPPIKPGEIEVSGLDRLDAALGKGRGCILLETNRFGRRNLAKQVLHARGYRLEQIHADSHLYGLKMLGRSSARLAARLKPCLDHLERNFIAKVHEIPAAGSLAYTRRLSSSLAQNHIVCSAGDGHIGEKLVELQFLGGKNRLPTGIISLARISGAEILPLFCYEQSGGKYLVEIGPALTKAELGFPIPEKVLAEYLRLLEDRVRRHPSQYFRGETPELRA